MNIKRITIYLIVFIFLFTAHVGADKKIPWHVRHFPNIPRISAEKALKLLLASVKIVIVDIPWSKKGFDEGHVCGAIKGSAHADKLDHLIKKIPKNYIILSY